MRLKCFASVLVVIDSSAADGKPKNYENPTYEIGTLTNSYKPSSNSNSSKKLTTATAATTAAPAEPQNQYAVVAKRKDSSKQQHDFDNPIYGDELLSNMYSQTSHLPGEAGPGQSLPPPSSSAPQHLPHEYSTLTSPELYDVPGSQPTAPAVVIGSLQLQPGEYNTLTLPEYDLPANSRHREQAASEQPPLHPDAAPVPAIYSEVEEGHTYSLLDNSKSH